MRATKEYQRWVGKIWPRETSEGLVEKLFKNRARLSRVAGDLLSDDEISLLLASSAAVKRRDMTATDVALLDEAHWLIDPGFRRFGHVVVDEAQNLTPMELRMTVRRARGQSLTILGDLSQRTADAGVSSWETVLGEAGVDAYDVNELAVSYRVPNEFLAIAGALLPPGAPAPVGVRSAPFPAVAFAGDVDLLAAREAARLASEVGSVGVIAPLALLSDVGAALGSYADAIHASLGAGVNLLGPARREGPRVRRDRRRRARGDPARAPRRRRRRALHRADPGHARAGDRARGAAAGAPAGCAGAPAGLVFVTASSCSG